VTRGDRMTGNEHTIGQVQIGALAKATGLTVRTLHHYDEIGLLVPEQRSSSGRRLYSEQDVRRLYRIVALRRLGLSLGEIGGVLDRTPDLVDAVRRHLARVAQDLGLQQRLHRTLERMLARLEQEREPILDDFIQSIEAMSMIDKYYTPEQQEQQEQLEQRRGELGEEGMRRAEGDWAELIEAAKAEQARGTEPTDPRMLELARRWRALIEQFTGGDDAVTESLRTMYREEGPKAASRGMVDPELMRYVGQALAGLGESE